MHTLLPETRLKDTSLYPAVGIVGPTASGKSALAGLLVGRFGAEIVSCDALQVYRGMDIGTAKPAPHERGAIPHHMIDICDPDEDFTAGDYQRRARRILYDIRQRGRLPLVVGGTGFYFRALIEGLFDGPGRSEEIRRRLRRIAGRKGAAWLHRRLARIDPEAAARIAPADTARTVRAYEIYLVSGRPMSWWQNQARDALQGFRWLKLGISWPRPQLYERIDARVEEMFAHGLVAEVHRLLGRYPKDCHAFTAIGYRQVILHLEGRLTLEQAVRETQQASRRYAKRQLTWFRADGEIVWLDASAGIEAAAAHAERLIEGFLIRGCCQGPRH